MRKAITILLFLSATTKLVEIPIPIVEHIVLDEVVVILDRPQYLKDFLRAMGQRESSNRYHVTNRYGYMGRYQFGMSTLETIGIKTTKQKFLKTPWLQERAMLRNLKHNKKQLKPYIEKYSGTIVDDTYITESGILAAAHIGGAGGVKKYFNKNIIKQDQNGTKITDYLTEFSGYNLKTQ